MGKRLQLIYLTDIKTKIGSLKPFVTGDKLLYDKEVLENINTLRPLVAPENVAKNKINKIRLQEQMINESEYTSEEKIQLLYQLKVNYFLELINEGYDRSSIEKEIDSAITGFKTSSIDSYDWICQLEEQRTALNCTTFNKDESVQQKSKNKKHKH